MNRIGPTWYMLALDTIIIDSSLVVEMEGWGSLEILNLEYCDAHYYIKLDQGLVAIGVR